MTAHLAPGANWLLIPPHMREGVELYLNSGICTGGFLSHFLCGNHFEAIRRADQFNREWFVNMVEFFLNYVDEEVYGSAAKVVAHCEKGKRS